MKYTGKQIFKSGITARFCALVAVPAELVAVLVAVFSSTATKKPRNIAEFQHLVAEVAVLLTSFSGFNKNLVGKIFAYKLFQIFGAGVENTATSATKTAKTAQPSQIFGSRRCLELLPVLLLLLPNR